jgi:hypothetical protein
MMARPVIFMAFALSFGFAATSGVQASPKHVAGGQGHESSGHSMKASAKPKHSNKGETKDYLVITLKEASVMEYDTPKTSPTKQSSHSPSRAAHSHSSRRQ